MRKFGVSVLFVFLCHTGWGQAGAIMGYVVTARGGALKDATVFLQSDSTVRADITDENGRFVFDGLLPGSYHLRAAHVGFSSPPPLPIMLNKEVDGVRILLTGTSGEGRVVRVKSHRRLVRISGDKLVYDPGALPGVNSDNALELLGKLPGLWVEADGRIYVSGNSPVTVLINGVRQTIAPAQIASLLQALPASQLEKVEVTTGGSYKYDASYGTVIDIQLKQRKSAGLTITGTNSVSINRYLSNQHSIYWAYRAGALTMNTSVDYARHYSYHDKAGMILYTEDDPEKTFIDYTAGDHYLNQTPAFIHSMSWDITKKGTLVLNFSAHKTGTGAGRRKRAGLKGQFLIQNSFTITGPPVN